MSLQPLKVPEYPLPNEDLHFLASENQLYNYGNLYAFTEWFEKMISPYQPGEENPVLLFGSSTNQHVFTLAACWLLQIPFFSLSTRMTDSELEFALSGMDPAVVITDPGLENRLAPLPSLTIEPDRLTMDRQVDRSMFSNSNPEKLMGYFLTSGSTGFPKIVPLKRRQIHFAAHASAENFKPEQNRYWLLCLPLNHMGGISIIIRCILYQAAIYRMNQFDAEQVTTFLSENKLFQVASLVPTMLNRLLRSPTFRVHRDVQAILMGGGPVTLPLIRETMERGIPIVSSYGMTETCGQIAANPFLKPSGIYHPKKSVGRIFEPNEIEIRDESGKKVPPQERGIVWLRGPQVFDGYLDPRHNQEAFDKDGWFNTGDYGHLNRRRQIFIESRRADRIITGGENVNPFDVESALEELDNIQEAAVVGVTEPEWGQAVTAFIRLTEDGEFNEETLKSKLKERLSSFKIPKKIIAVEQFPLLESGKIDREKLRRSARSTPQNSS